MGSDRVKLKLSRALPLVLVFLALASFATAAMGLFPAVLVENWYARGAFPRLSVFFTSLARVINASWLDLLLPSGLLVAAYLTYRRRPAAILGLVASGYLLFFWGWGLNYQRPPIETKLDYRDGQVTPDAVAALTAEAADRINATYAQRRTGAGTDDLVEEADARVRAVVELVDGIPGDIWSSPAPVKRSRLLDPLFRAGTVDGMFNPFWHEAVLTGGLLEFELPVTMMHELAHLRGYANEGEANFIAFLSAVGSANPEFQYSGWLMLWMYLRYGGADDLLDSGPKQDLAEVRRRLDGGRVEWVNRTQARTLDLFLKSNRVDGGVRSYAQIVRLAVATRHDWDRFTN